MKMIELHGWVTIREGYKETFNEGNEYIVPGTKMSAQLPRKFIQNPFQGEK